MPGEGADGDFTAFCSHEGVCGPGTGTVNLYGFLGHSCLYYNLHSYFIFQLQLTLDVILAPGVQHPGETFIQRMKWSPRKSSKHLAPYVVVTTLLTIPCAALYIPRTTL